MQNTLQGQIQPQLHLSFPLMFLEGVFQCIGAGALGFGMKM